MVSIRGSTAAAANWISPPYEPPTIPTRTSPGCTLPSWATLQVVTPRAPSGATVVVIVSDFVVYAGGAAWETSVSTGAEATRAEARAMRFTGAVLQSGGDRRVTTRSFRGDGRITCRGCEP